MSARPGFSWWLDVAAPLIGAAAILAGLAIMALAHSWYPYECCSDLDCHMVPAERVRTTPAGYLLDDGTLVSYREARPSPDGQFHVCRREAGKGALIRLHEKPACFWAPMGAS